MSAETFAEMKSMDEIARRLGPHREQLLQTFTEYDGDKVDTPTVRLDSDVEKSLRHHLEMLSQWGLLKEHNTRRYTPGGGSDARQWSLTDRGREFTAEYVGEPVATENVEDLTQRIAELEAEVDALRDQHEKDMENMRSRIQSGIKEIKKVVT